MTGLCPRSPDSSLFYFTDSRSSFSITTIMRRFAVTGFALLYAVLVYGSHTDRTSLWLETLTDQATTQQHDTINVQDNEESRKVPKGQKRTLPNQFAFAPPLIALGIILKSNRYVALHVEEQIPERFHRSISPRAPPVLS